MSGLAFAATQPQHLRGGPAAAPPGSQGGGVGEGGLSPPGLPEVTTASSSLAPVLAQAVAVFSVASLAIGRGRRSRAPRHPFGPSAAARSLVSCQAEGSDAQADAEAEAIFREAYEAEAERAKLLRSQLEAALRQQLGIAEGEDSPVQIAVNAPQAFSPLESPGVTWRQAFQDIKKRTASLEEQLKKSRGASAPARPPAPASAAPASSAPRDEATPPPAAEPFASPSSGSSQPGGALDPMQMVERIREVAAKAAEEDAVLRLLAMGEITNQDPFNADAKAPGQLPPMERAREALASQDFVVAESITFERCYVFTGAVAPGRDPGQALESMQSRVRSLGASGAETELYLQPAKEEGKALLIMLHSDSLRFDGEVPWWQWVFATLLVVVSFLASNTTSLAVFPFTPQMGAEMASILDQVQPIGFGVIGTVAASEVARRAVAASYGVELSPPFLLPTWPIGSLGCLGAVNRRLSTVPNREAEYGMSLAAAISGFLVSGLFIAAGLAAAPVGKEALVDLNFQILPGFVKLLLRPLLGASAITSQPDPFADPMIVAFHAAPALIGGVCGLIITALSLLPIGKLDGGVIARNVFGPAAGTVSAAGFLLLLAGGLAEGDIGALYFSFALAALFWQGGQEPPPKEAVTEIPGAQKALGALLVVTGFVLSIPGNLFPPS
eukprot:TRINITY_DN62704_c0_g1_i1.p1 TRINITY_DN62704_c0_g1~~TRINITY_DN62704_c0_g1_i1.p1  ORF type:complete len:680 (+),score=147.85 TRINITY_DN62704_c0_g1_i1:32-2041(+)